MYFRRPTIFIAFLIGLHLLPLLKVWGFFSGRPIAPGVCLLSLATVGLGFHYLRRCLRREKSKMTAMDLWVLLYAIASGASVVLYLQTDNPSGSKAFLYGLYHLLLPMACYFAMKGLSRGGQRRVLACVVLLNAFVLAYGFYLHVFRPTHYINFLTLEMLSEKGYTDIWQFFSRLQSYLGSTTVGYLGAVNIVLASIVFSRARLLFIGLLALSTLGTAFSMQRSSIVGVAIALSYICLASGRPLLFRIIALAAVSGALAYGVVHFEDEAGRIDERLRERATTEVAGAVSGVFEDRGYGLAFEYLRDFPLGLGLGATSSAAASAGLAPRGEVVDANFMRIATDLGIPGLLLFLAVAAAATMAALRSDHRAGWLAFLVIHFGVMLGTNVLDSFYVSQMFWICLAFIDNDRHLGRNVEIVANRRAPSLSEQDTQLETLAGNRCTQSF